jgi:hypothetical protein
MKSSNRFARGSGCFKCTLCGKETRDTGDHGAARFCPLCFEKTICGNGLSDNTPIENPWDQFEQCTTVEEVQQRYQQLLDEHREVKS